MLPSIFVPNILITRNYEAMKKFMKGKSLQDIKSEELLDSFMFLSEQNKYIYSLEHSHNFGQSDLLITLKILDSDGNFESSVLTDNYINKTLATKMEKFFADNISASSFNAYMSSYAHGNIRVYISYGIGDNLDNWADPKCCTLVGASIDVASNGVRSYEYKFQPLPNAFFSLIPEKDNSDPNSNDIFNIPFASMEVTEDIYVTDPDQVSINVKEVMTGFAAKAVSTPKTNTIILIPDIDKQYLEFKSIAGPGARDLYQKIFKSISFNYWPANTAEQPRLYSTDANNEKEAENRKDREDYRKRINKQLDKKKNSLIKQKQELLSQITYLSELVRANEGNKSFEYEKYINQINELIGKFDEVENKLLSVEKEEQQQQTKEPYEGKLVMRSFVDENNKDKLVPDTRKSIQQVFDGINIFFEGNLPPSMSFETNLKWLKIFKHFELIENEEIPCLVIGDRGLILHYLYGGRFLRNQTDIGYSFSKLDSLSSLETDEYKNYVIDILGTNKTNSSFSELLAIDELSLGNKQTKEALQEIQKISSKQGKPIFVSNFKNSNVLSFSLKNTESYGSVINQTVRDGRLKYLYSLFDDEKKKLFLKNLGLDPSKLDTSDNSLKNSDPAQLATIIYDKAKKFLEENKIDKNKKITSQELTITENLLGGYSNENTKRALFAFKRDEIFSQISKIFSLKTPQEDPDGMGAPTKVSEKIKGLVINETGKEELSLIDLTIRNILVNDYKVNSSSLASLSQFIVLINSLEKEDNSHSIMTPGIFTPGDTTLMARAFEYSKKLAVELSIKTLPFFHLSNFDTISRKCTFLSKRNTIFGGKPTNVFDYFSGEYLITGFRHVITTSECYSEFLLNKFGSSDDGPANRKFNSSINAVYEVDNPGKERTY